MSFDYYSSNSSCNVSKATTLIVLNKVYYVEIQQICLVIKVYGIQWLTVNNHIFSIVIVLHLRIEYKKCELEDSLSQ